MPAGRRDPFEGVSDFFSEMNRMWEVGRGGVEHGSEDRSRTHATAWVPATDIFSRGEDLVIRVDLAGMSPDDVSVTFSHGVLTVSGQRRTELGTDGEDSFYVRERFHGAFRRAITLPEGTDESRITAEFENGLVEITVRGGAGGHEPRRIALRDRSAGVSSRSLG